MHRTSAKHFFLRVVASVLVSSIVATDCDWAATATVSHVSCRPAPILFSSEAVVPQLDGAFDGSKPAIQTRRRATALIAGIFLLPSIVTGQQKTPPKKGPVQRQPVPQAEAVERQNRRLTDAQWKDAWRDPDQIADPT